MATSPIIWRQDFDGERRKSLGLRRWKWRIDFVFWWVFIGIGWVMWEQLFVWLEVVWAAPIGPNVSTTYPPQNDQLGWKLAAYQRRGVIVNEALQVEMISPLPMNGLPTTGKTTPNTTMPFQSATHLDWCPNRLLGALGGLATLIVELLSFGQWRRNKWIPCSHGWWFVGIGVQRGWENSGRLQFVTKITLHMVMALVIVALLLYLYFISKEQRAFPVDSAMTSNWLFLP